jgi:hypothetical protein
MSNARLPARLALTALALALVNVAGADSTVRYTTRPNLDGIQGAPSQADGPLVVGRNRLIITKTGGQSETTIAVDPTNGNHLLASSNDLSNLSGFNNVRESVDGGRTWVNSGVTINTFCYDPWLSFNANGDAFFAYECGDQRIAYKLAGTSTWVHRTLQNSSLFPDRDMVVVDTHAGSPFLHSVYVGYDEANAGNAAHVWYSRDGLANWSKSPTINDDGQTIGVNVATCPDGSIYAFWEDWQQRRLEVDRSTDGGATWSTDHIVHTYRLNTTSFFIFIPPQPQRGVLPMPFSDCAPAGGAHPGRLYVTYFDKSPTSADTDAYVRFSDDGGVTWSSEAEVDDETVNAYQFHVNIAVGPDGTVGVGFYDTRADFPANKKTHRFISYSTDGGVTWSTNEQVASRQSDESGFGDANDYGDYQGIDARPDAGFWSVWTDSRPALDGEDVVGARTRP